MLSRPIVNPKQMQILKKADPDQTRKVDQGFSWVCFAWCLVGPNYFNSGCISKVFAKCFLQWNTSWTTIEIIYFNSGCKSYYFLQKSKTLIPTKTVKAIYICMDLINEINHLQLLNISNSDFMLSREMGDGAFAKTITNGNLYQKFAILSWLRQRRNLLLLISQMKMV